MVWALGRGVEARSVEWLSMLVANGVEWIVWKKEKLRRRKGMEEQALCETFMTAREALRTGE